MTGVMLGGQPSLTLVAVYALGALVGGYLFGSIPFGVIFTRAAGLGDVRSIGSGNIGATNVLRTGRKGIALATLLCDALKGTLAILVMRLVLPGGEIVDGLTALGAFIGHLYPVWLRFRGGKGVATFLGCLLALSPWAALAFGVVWLGCAVVTRYSSLSALVASAVSPVVLFAFYPGRFLLATVAAMVVALWWKHRENIKRLLEGSEGKIGEKG